MKACKVLLFAGGIFGALFYLPILVISSLWGWTLGGPSMLEWVLFAAPLVIFCFYPWVIWRSWHAARLLKWGVIVHLPLVYWVPRGGDEPEFLILVAVLLLGLLIYAAYTWLVWSRASTLPA